MRMKRRTILLAGIILALGLVAVVSIRLKESPSQAAPPPRPASSASPEPPDPSVIKTAGAPPFFPSIPPSALPAARSLTKDETDIYEQAKKSARARALDQTYATMYQELGWNAEQIAVFRAIELRRFATGDQYGERLMLKGEPPDQNTTQAIFDAVRTQADADLLAAFGDQGLSQIKNFDRTRPARTVVNELAVAMLYGPEPLTSAQARELVGIIAANAVNPGTGKVDITFLNEGALHEAIAQKLTAPQRESLQRIIDNKRAPSGPLQLAKDPEK